MEKLISVGLVQINAKKLDLDYNFTRSVDYIRSLAAKGAQIICTPECMLDGYSFDHPDFKNNPQKFCVDPENSPYLKQYAQLCAELNIYLVVGASIIETKDPPIYRNAALLFGPEGREIGRYSKTHSTYDNFEAKFYKPGEKFPVFDVSINSQTIKIGIMICYDRQIPEVARILRIQGAQIILNPVATNNFGRSWNTRLMQTRAYENKCFIVSVNYGWPRLSGNSLVINPRGRILARCLFFERTRKVKLNLIDLEKGKKDIQTRRPEIYQKLSEENT